MMNITSFFIFEIFLSFSYETSKYVKICSYIFIPNVVELTIFHSNSEFCTVEN
jgi:hypothetical protein